MKYIMIIIYIQHQYGSVKNDELLCWKGFSAALMVLAEKKASAALMVVAEEKGPGGQSLGPRPRRPEPGPAALSCGPKACC